jgi:hypothetical protein
MTKQFLYNLYHIKKLSTYKIAKIYKVSAECIFYRLKRFNIKLRTLKGNHSWNFKGGKSRFPNCKDCGIRMSRLDAIRCKKCDLKFRKGINGRNYKGLELPKCIDCNKKLSRKTAKRCVKCNVIFWKLNPRKHPAYIHGKSKEPYAFGFTRELKVKIRKRDNHTCKLCNKQIISNTKEYFLAVHHIDYDKNNCKEDNLISLCGGCNSKVNHNRNKWIKYFKKIIKQLIRRI